MSLITEEVGTRAAAGFTIEEIKDIDETTGEFTIVATTDYDYVSAEKAGKTQMVALHVDGSALSEGESNDFETDFTSLLSEPPMPKRVFRSLRRISCWPGRCRE